MPQMAPYNWLFLFMLFNILMMFIISHNHYIYMIYPSLKLEIKSKFIMSW